jgi:hypothetical protein
MEWVADGPQQNADDPQLVGGCVRVCSLQQHVDGALDGLSCETAGPHCAGADRSTVHRQCKQGVRLSQHLQGDTAALPRRRRRREMVSMV